MKFSDIPRFTRNGNWECNFPLNNLVRQIEEWEREEGLDMNPDFQRGHVWTEQQQIDFIEFILKGGNTGRVIYLNHPTWMGSFDTSKSDIGFVCVDGLQRYTAIKRFIKNEIKAFGYFYKEFEGSIRMVNDMKINVNDLPTKKDVLKWYIEMNSGGTPHTEEEINRVKKLLEECK
ncbi:DUF262 domain-containing protein [Tissierella praeacuta]|uniref:DUF262 domain-containing protein n=1 Tax=Tissierella praeacuta TaxID=43131 RepID=UPI003DA53DB9